MKNGLVSAYIILLIGSSGVARAIPVDLSDSPQAGWTTGFDALIKLQPEVARGEFEELLASNRKIGSEDQRILDTIGADKRFRVLKVALSFSGAKGPLLNNVAATYLLQGDTLKALETLDQAAVLAPDDSAIWTNAALANLDLSRLAVVRENIGQARALGDRSTLLTVIEAELALRNQEFSTASNLVKSAEATDPENPYLLLIKARLEQELGSSRESEKSLLKAILQGPAVASESLLIPKVQRGYFVTGGTRAFHVDAASKNRSATGRVANWELVSDRLDVEGRAEAYQWRERFSAVFADRVNSLILQHRTAGGGRPGAEESIAGQTPNSDSQYRMVTSSAIWSHELLSQRNTIAFLGKYRTTNLQTKTSATKWADQIQDDTFSLETRWLRDLAPGSKLTAGFAWTQFKRSSTDTRPFDPAEVVMPDGTTRAWVGYATVEKQLNSNLRATVGTLAAKLADATILQPVAELSYGKSRPIRFGISSRVNDVVSDLIPSNLIAQAPLTNTIDRHNQQPQDFNVNPVLSGRETRFLNYEVSVPGRETGRVKENIVVFHRRMENALFQAADPRVATNQVLTPVKSAEATGFEFRTEQALTRNLRVNSQLTYQFTSGSPANPTFSIDSFPSQVPTAQNTLANFPRLQLHTAFELNQGFTTYTLTLAYMGARERAVTVRNGSGDFITYVGQADPALGIHFYVRRNMGENVKLLMGLYNLGRARFYAGYPASITGFMGFEYRY